MGGDAPAIEQPGRRKEEHTCAHRTVAAHGRGAPTEPSRNRRVDLVEGRIAAHEKSIDRLVGVVYRRVREKAQVAGSPNRSYGGAHDLHLLSVRIAEAARGLPKHLL